MTLTKLITYWELKGFNPEQYSNEPLTVTEDGELMMIQINNQLYRAIIYYILQENNMIRMLHATVYYSFIESSFNNDNIYINKARVKDLEKYFI